MSSGNRQAGGPQGGLAVQPRVVRRWRWSPKGELLSAPVRCKREQWYLAQAFPAAAADGSTPDLQMRFLDDDGVISERCIGLERFARRLPTSGLSGMDIYTRERDPHAGLRSRSGTRGAATASAAPDCRA